MGMRITTNMIRRNYQNNLMNSVGGLESARKQVETGRRFQWSYEDPSASAKGMILERRSARNADYINTVKSSQKWIDSQSDVLTQVSGYINDIDKDYSVSAMDDPKGQVGREAYAANLRELQNSIVNALNTQYGDTFLMGGSDGRNLPFEITESGEVLYQGINVNDTEKMKELANQKLYVDIGFGMSFDKNGDVIPSSAFDMAYPGIQAIGYGTASNPEVTIEINGEKQLLSNNLLVLAGQMAQLLEQDVTQPTNVDPDAADAGDVQDPLSKMRDTYSILWNQFHKGCEKLQNQFSQVGAKANLLTKTLDRLETEKINIQEQYKDTVGIDEALAISNLSWAKDSYDAALKIGTSILGQSLLDYMK